MTIQDLNKTGEAVFTATLSAEEVKLLVEACYMARVSCDLYGGGYIDSPRVRELEKIMRSAWHASQWRPDGSARV